MPHETNQHQTRTPNLTWRMTWTLPQTPACPACGVALQPDTVQIRGGIALCTVCARGSQAALDCHRLLLSVPHVVKHLRCTNGVLFWVPTWPLHGNMTACEALDQLAPEWSKYPDIACVPWEAPANVGLCEVAQPPVDAVLDSPAPAP